LAAGSNLRLGVHADGPDLRGAADTLASIAAPPAMAAEPADMSTDASAPSPILYVKYNGRWVTEDDRVAAQAQAKNDADMQAQRVADDASVAGAIENAAGRPGPLMPAPERNRGGEPTDPPPPPLIVSMNDR
jgi:hypothetical protein